MSPFARQIASAVPRTRLCGLWAEAVDLTNRLSAYAPLLAERAYRREQRRWRKYQDAIARTA